MKLKNLDNTPKWMISHNRGIKDNTGLVCPKNADHAISSDGKTLGELRVMVITHNIVSHL